MVLASPEQNHNSTQQLHTRHTHTHTFTFTIDLRNYFGLSPAKKKKTDEEKKEIDRERRKGGIMPDWTEQFDWLLTNEGELFCEPCKTIGYNGIY